MNIAGLVKSFKKQIFLFIVFLIFLFSFVSKVHNLGAASFDFDEIWSVKFTKTSYRHIITGRRYDPGNPPLYFLILKAWKSWWGESEFRLRLLSVIFHLIAFGFLYLQSKKHLKPTASLIVLLLFASSGLLFFFSRYVRAYSLAVLITVAVFPLLLDFIEKDKPAWSKAIVAYFLCLVGLYSHYSFIIYYIFLFLTFLFHCRRFKKKLMKLLSFTGLVVLGYWPWARYFLLNQIIPRYEWHRYDFGQVRGEWIGFGEWFSVFTNGLSRKLIPIQFQTIFAIFLLLIFDYLLIRLYRSEDNLWKKSVLFFFLLSFNSLIFTPLHRIFNDLRYSIYILPFAFLSFGILVDSFKGSLMKPLRPWKGGVSWAVRLLSCLIHPPPVEGRGILRREIKYAILAFLIPFSLLTYSSYMAPVPEDWRSLGKRIPQHEEGAVLLFHPCFFGFSLDYYYKGNLPQYCFFENPEGMYLKIWDKKPQKTLYLVIRPWRWSEKLFEDFLGGYSVKESERFGNVELVVLRR